MTARRARLARWVGLWAGLAIACAAALAGGLQVSPVTLSLQPSQSADGIWLSNAGDAVVQAQVRVYHWVQSGGGEQLVPSRGLVISPPMLKLDPGERQLVRVIRAGPPPTGPGAGEDAYRLAIDELPLQTRGRRGLQFVLHYSIPIFILPAGAAATPPKLEWSLQREGNQVLLEVSNRGGTHAQLAGLAHVGPGGQRTEISTGLLGYVLPGATMRWALGPAGSALSGTGTLEAMVNGEKLAQTLAVADRTR